MMTISWGWRRKGLFSIKSRAKRLSTSIALSCFNIGSVTRLTVHLLPIQETASPCRHTY